MGLGFFPLWSLLDASLFAHSDHRDDEGKHPADGGGPPAIDLGPIPPAGDQPQPEPNVNDTSPKPATLDPGKPAPPHHEPKSDIDPNVGDGGNKPADAKPMNPETPDTAPPKPGLDPEAGKNTPDIPIFLGPSNNSPPPGSSGPSSNAPQKSGNPDDEERYGYSDDTPCGGILDGPLVNLLSSNGGDGGDASSGTATRQGRTSSLIMSLTLTRSKASGTVGSVAILRTVVPVVMPLGVL